MQERASCGWATTAFLAGREIKIVTKTKAMREVDFLTRRKLNNDFETELVWLLCTLFTDKF